MQTNPPTKNRDN